MFNFLIEQMVLQNHLQHCMHASACRWQLSTVGGWMSLNLPGLVGCVFTDVTAQRGGAWSLSS
jgi:hypothetical protein